MSYLLYKVFTQKQQIFTPKDQNRCIIPAETKAFRDWTRGFPTKLSGGEPPKYSSPDTNEVSESLKSGRYYKAGYGGGFFLLLQYKGKYYEDNKDLIWYMFLHGGGSNATYCIKMLS